MQDARRQLLDTAEEQHGLVTSQQAIRLMGRDAVRNLIRVGELERHAPGMLRVRGSAPTEIQATAAAVLAAGRTAALSATSALAHWGVRGFVVEPIHVVRRRDVDDHKVRGVTIHEVRFLPVREVRVLEGIPLVSPSLALLQLAGTRCSDWKLGGAIDAAWTDRLVTYTTLTAIDQTMSRQGRRGLTRFREAVEERGPDYVPPASNLERRFEEILVRAGRTPMRRQADVSGEEGWIGRVDFKDDPLPLIAEVQSTRFHRGLTAERSDKARIARLEAAGHEVLEITDEDIWYRADEVLARVDAARARAARRAA
jgi:very-short-patch-repair endonuclease